MKLFEDMFSSHRGAGVIGTLVAVGVLAVLGALFILVFDEDFQGGEQTIESVIRDQAKQTENLVAGIANRKKLIADAKRYKTSADELASFTRQLQSKKALTDDALARIEVIKESMKKKQAEWDQYIIDYRKAERFQEIGKQYPELVTKSGRVYKAVTIKKIDDLRVSVSHDGGSGSIPWNELPADLIDRLQFTQALADQQQKMELGAAEHFSTAAKASDIQSSIASIRQKMEETTAAFQIKKASVTQSDAKINDSRNQINRLQGMIQAEANKEGLRQGPRYRSQIQDHERIIETENNRIKEFVAIETKYNETMNELQKQLAELTKKLESVKQ